MLLHGVLVGSLCARVFKSLSLVIDAENTRVCRMLSKREYNCGLGEKRVSGSLSYWHLPMQYLCTYLHEMPDEASVE